MKKIILLFAILPYICFSQSPPSPIVPFDNWYYDADVKGVIQSKDGNYIVLFHNYNSGEDNLIKLDSLGTTIWSSNPLPNNLNPMLIDTCYDNGFIIVGNDEMIKTDQYGNLLWSVTLGSISQLNNEVTIIKSTLDSCFLIVSDDLIVKIDSLGNVLYSTHIDINVLPNSVGSVSIRDILSTDDGVVVVGIYDNVVDPWGTYLFGGYLAKFNNQGMHQWSKEFSGWYYDYMEQVMSTDDGGYILLGSSESFCSSTNNINSFWLIKTDSLGNVEWEKNNTHCDEMTFGSAMSFDSFDSKYMIVGMKFNSNDTALVIITDSIGNEIDRVYIGELWYPEINDNIIFGASGSGERILRLDPNAIGCADPIALNYDSTATLNNGSCVYGKTYVPDDIFEAYLEAHGMGDSIPNNDSVSTQMIIDVTGLSITNSFISDLTGIEDFRSLEALYCWGNQLTNLDVSNNTALTRLECGDNQLASLDVSNNTALRTLWCEDNLLTSLDVSANNTLIYLYCHYNQLTILDLGGIDLLEVLYCRNNNLTTLNITNSVSLDYLNCSHNQITWLDVIQCDQIEELNCSFNQLTSLDFNNNMDIHTLDCSYNQLTSLDLRNGNNWNITSLYSNDNPNLYCVDVDLVTLATGRVGMGNWQIDSVTSFSTDCANALGCTDSIALNWDSLATINNGSCLYAGCMDSIACNYNPSNVIDDGSCLYPSLDTIVVSTCMSDPQAPNEYYFLIWNGFEWITQVLTQSGMYTAFYPDSITTYGCDSTVILDLTISNTSSLDTTITSCDSYTWHGVTYTVSGTYTNTYTNVLGCDSTHILNLTINNSTTRTITETACDFYEWCCGYDTLTTSGTYTAVVVNSVGCDSVVTLNLTINNSTSNTTTVAVCEEYYWALTGVTYTESGTYSTIDTNAAGCLHTEYLDLTIYPSYAPEDNSTDTTVFCSYTWPLNGQTYTADSMNSSGSNTFYLTWQSVNGCDSMAQLNLTIDTIAYNTTTITACNSYSWEPDPSHMHTYDSSGTYVAIYSSPTCANSWQGDTLILTINNSNTGSSSATACDSYTWNGATYTTSGTYTWVGVNAAGCDSTHTLNLTINNSTTSTSSVTACDTYTWDGVAYTTSGVYTNTYTNAAGCDSVHTLTVTINNSTTSTTAHTACDSYTWNGTTYTVSGTYTHSTTNANGCDSTTILNLTINYPNTGSSSVTACDTYTWDGVAYTASGAYTNTYTNSAGCDSVHTLNLTINTTTSSIDTHVACDSFTWFCDGNTYTTSNNTATYIYTNAAGCDSTVTLNLTIKHSTTGASSATACESYSWDGVDYTTSGDYSNTYTNTIGCDSVHTLNLTINNSTTSTSIETNCDSLLWNGTTYTTSGTYTWVGVNALGCDSIATLNFTSGITSTITQFEDSLYADVYPSGVDYSAQWFNIDTETGETWLMGEDISFGPRFDCNYILVTTTSDGCVDTTDVFFFAEFAGQIYDLKVSPNPTRDRLNIKYVNERNQFVRIYLANSNGVVLDEFISSDNEMNIDISKYPSGVYYVYFSSEEHCSSEEQQISRKIILNK